ncbi:uncharacterized protein LOC127260326 [Andrographis paniculata]|uniref:uncharacterized protein LOC127260326 n=1 Tax=Andrographis paniculata TaxID=175694 RepID=UPI0021E85423|nr:uncharacterized protein LOC127260326 [Andrographis paniculata]
MEVGLDCYGVCDRITKVEVRRGCHWVLVDRLTEAAVFIPIIMTWSMQKLARLYIQHVVKRYGVPEVIVSDRNLHFESNFLQKLHKEFNTWLRMTTAFHLMTDGQIERTIQILEDMLQAFAFDSQGWWEDQLALVEFS